MVLVRVVEVDGADDGGGWAVSGQNFDGQGALHRPESGSLPEPSLGKESK